MSIISVGIARNDSVNGLAPTQINAADPVFALLAQADQLFTAPGEYLIDLGFAASVPAGYGVMLVSSLPMAVQGLSVKGYILPSIYTMPLQVPFEYTRNANFQVQKGDVLAFAFVVSLAPVTLNVT